MAETDPPIDERTHQLLVKVAHGLIAVVGIIVLVVSSYYLRRYAINTGMPEWLAWTLFVALDAGGTAGTLCWLLATGSVRTWGKVIALANLSASIVGNVLGHLIEARMLPVTPLLVILTGVVYPAELWALVHLGIQLRTQRPADVSSAPETIAAQRIPEPAPPTVEVPAPRQSPPTVSNPLTAQLQRSAASAAPQRINPPPRPAPNVPARRQAANEGRTNSRHRKITPKIEAEIRSYWEQGLPLQEVTRRSGYGDTVCKRIKQAMREVERENRERVAS